VLTGRTSGALSSLSVKYYPRVFISGWLWNVTRWMGVFLGSFLVNAETGSPLAVQLVGAAFFIPMFLGGLLAGAVSDRFDRRRTLLRNLAVLVPTTMLMAFAVGQSAVELWMIYLFMAIVGVGGVLDMTSRRALVHDLVGDQHITNALALEMFSLASGNMAGFLFAGAVLDFVGEPSAYVLIAVAYGLSFVMLASVPARSVTALGATTGADEPVVARAGLREDFMAGAAFLASSAPLRSTLGVTVIVNVFMFSFLPLVPVFADRLGIGAFQAGLLASAMGTGMMLSSLWVAMNSQARRGVVYTVGAFLATGALLGLPLAPRFLLAYPAVLVAGFGGGLFGATQSAVVITIAGPELRGRALGMLSMAIGGLPFGIVALGVVAERIGAAAALLWGLSLGLVLLVVWLRRRPEVMAIE